MSSSERAPPANGSKRKVHLINCIPCRRRKSKCDREEPCSSCVLRHTQAYCYTQEELPAPSPAPPTASSSKRTLDTPPAPSKTRRIHASPGTTSSTRAAASGAPAHRMPADLAQGAVDSIASSLHVVQRFLDEARAGARPLGGMYISWDDLLAMLPPLDECRQIFHCFFTELSWIVTCVHRARFEAMWAEAQASRAALPRHRASLVCSMIAYVGIMGPKAHPAAQLKRKPSLNHKVQRENARVLCESFYLLLDDEEEEARDVLGARTVQADALLQLEAEAETLYCSYSCTAGLVRRGWQGLGRAIRLAKSLALFDETRWHGDESDDELRRRIGWDLITLDRWTGLSYLRTFELGTHIRLREPSYESDSALHWRNSMSNVLARVVDFLRTCHSLDMTHRAAYADAIEADFTQWERNLPPELQYDTACSTMTSSNPHSFRLAAKALAYQSSYRFALCTLMRPFLMDPSAPPHLRFAALQHARKIIESMHILVTLCNSPWVSFPPAWNAQHLFASATTFATVFLSDSERANGDIWPAEDLDWFASALFEVVDTFHLVAQGTQHHTARVCKDLLVALCNSKDALKERFQKRERLPFRPSTPVIFADSSRNGPPDSSSLDPALPPALQPPPKQTEVMYNGAQAQAQPSEGASNDVLLDNFFLFDPWEWARMTADLDSHVM